MKRLLWLLALLPGLAFAQGGGVSALAFNVVNPASGQVLTYNGKVWVNGSAGSGTLPSCATNQLVYYAANGSAVVCLTLGTNLSITGGTLNAAGAGSPAFSSITGATNTTAAMVVGSGASLAPSGIAAGVVTANNVLGVATASLPTCNSSTKGNIAYTTDGTPSFVFCNGTSWVGGGGTPFTVAGTGCTPTGAVGGATAGKFTLAAGPCTAVTVTMNGSVGMTAPNGWHCNVNDQTLQAGGTWFGEWGESASTTTTATLPIPSASGSTDNVTFNCVPY